MTFGRSHSSAQGPGTAPDAQASSLWCPTDIDTLTLTPLPALGQEAPVLIEMCFICGAEPDPEMGSWYNQHFRKKPTDFDANLHGAAVHDVSAGLSCNNCRNKARRAGGLAQLLSSKLRLPMVARTLDERLVDSESKLTHARANARKERKRVKGFQNTIAILRDRVSKKVKARAETEQAMLARLSTWLGVKVRVSAWPTA